jgi:hypothetical protein
LEITNSIFATRSCLRSNCHQDKSEVAVANSTTKASHGAQRLIVIEFKLGVSQVKRTCCQIVNQKAAVLIAGSPNLLPFGGVDFRVAPIDQVLGF